MSEFVLDLADIPGQEHVKRAIEVAVAGEHNLMLIGGSYTSARLLARAGYELTHSMNRGSLARFDVKEKCPCGHFGSLRQACTCDVAILKNHWSVQFNAYEMAQYPMFIEVTDDDPHKIMAFLEKPKRYETSAVVAKRIFEADEREPSKFVINSEISNLLKAAIMQMSLNWPTVAHIIAVSETIARLQGETEVRVIHLAEAIQYRPRFLNPILNAVDTVDVHKVKKAIDMLQGGYAAGDTVINILKEALGNQL